MTLSVANNMAELVGNTDLVKINSLSTLTGCDIYLKCEFQNPGGSIKDRAALQLVKDAEQRGDLKPGMTIVEGTAGNTGIGLAIVGKALGYDVLTVMPSGQAIEKERMIALHGAKLKLVAPCPFANPNHFYHTAQRIAADNPNYWWANQFENESNMRAHYLQTGPEIWQQTQGNIDILVSVCGTGGTIAGTSKYLKEQKPELDVWLVDPDGSGIYNYLKEGEYKAQGSSFTEGIGIMRTVKNFEHACIDKAVNLSDQDLLTISRYVRDNDGIVLGSSSALNVAGALLAAIKSTASQPNQTTSSRKTIVTFACDLGERSYSKLYNATFLADQGLQEYNESIEAVISRYQQLPETAIVNVSEG
ncbi:cysteine synthase A [Flocculibacter collagenilyticus]|uniref:cysteine synthase A n=1 Tax=Flocculibacter collagenilyticus TaxID=2744479 RepID=UPI0018F3A9E3|nr:cysteine synthase A [Flocculibacter collagenilyticus]